MVITRISIDNYKSLVNFDWHLYQVNLLAGGNGSGKSSVLEVVSKLKCIIIAGARIPETFSHRSFTLWGNRDTQSFAIQLKHGIYIFKYELIIRMDRVKKISLIEHEQLMANEVKAYEYDGKKKQLQIFLDPNIGSDDPSFGFGASRSFLSEIEPRKGNEALIAFRDAMTSLAVLKPDQTRLRAISEEDSETLLPNCENLVDWYRSWASNYPERAAAITGLMQTSMPDLSGLRLIPRGTARELQLEFSVAGKVANLTLDELSDGQRMLLIVACVSASKKFRTLFLDEPDNFVAPKEIAPLLQILENPDDIEQQLTVITHHPQSIDYLASRNAFLFKLENGITRLSMLSDIDLDGISLSEAMRDQVV